MGVANKLTKLFIEAAKVGRHSDGDGLYLQVEPAGKYWRLRYSYGGKENLLSLGVYPEVSLKDARERRDAAKVQLRKGLDPAALKKAERRRQRSARIDAEALGAFGAVAEEWLAKQSERLAQTTYSKTRSILDNLLLPWLSARPIAEVTPPEILSVLMRIEERGMHETAHRAKRLCSRIFRYAIATSRATNDPTAILQGALRPVVSKPRAAITDPALVGELLRASKGYSGSFVTCCALRLSPMLFVRPGELRRAEWVEIDFDEAVWRIPAAKMKMRLDHVVPLSRQALAILRELQSLTGQGKYVFPGERDRKRPMSENTVNAALRRMGFEKNVMTAHGFRAMASTLLNESGRWSADVIERQLAHVEKNSVRAVYNRSQYLAQRREMMQYWSDNLDALCGSMSR